MKIIPFAIAALLLAGPALADANLDKEVEKAAKDLRGGKPESAVKRLAKYAEKNPSGAAYIALADVQALVGTTGGGGIEAATVSAVRAAQVASPGADKAHALAGLARLDLLGGTGADALKHAQQGVEAHGDADSFLALTLAQARLQNYAAASDAAKRATAANPGAAEAQAARGFALLPGSAPEAVGAFRKALELRPDWALAQVGFVEALSLSGQHAEAVAAGRAATAAHTASAEAYAALARAILREAPQDAAHLNDAIGEAQQGKFLNERSVVAQQTVGEIFAARGNLTQAQLAYETALKVDPGFVPSRAALIQIKVRRKDLDGALADADALVRETPNSAVSHLQRGRVLVRQEQWATALIALEKAVELGPGLAEAWALLGTAYQYNRRTADGAAAYRKATTLEPENHDYRTVYGLFLGMTGEHSQGIEELKKVTSDPGYKAAGAWVNLGWCYRNARPRRPQLSVDAYTRALEIEPDNGHAALGLGWAYSYVQPRQWARSEEAFQKAAQIDEAFAGEAYSGVGWVRFFTQDLEGSVEYLQKARDHGRFDRRLAQQLELAAEAMRIVLAYNDLEPGMSYERVQEILGSPGRETERDETSITYQWDNPDETYVVVVLENGVLVDKLHTGLEALEDEEELGGEVDAGEEAAPGEAEAAPGEAKAAPGEAEAAPGEAEATPGEAEASSESAEEPPE